MALANVELETLVSEPDALTTRPPKVLNVPKLLEILGYFQTVFQINQKSSQDKSGIRNNFSKIGRCLFGLKMYCKKMHCGLDC